MSEKMRTFVADLGIVPSATIKYSDIMARKCIFKVTACGETFRVIAVEELGEETLWAVLQGRVYATKPFLYRRPDECIDRAIYLAKLELHKNDLLMFEP